MVFNKIKRRIKSFFQIGYRYFFTNSVIILDVNANVRIHPTSKLYNCRFYIHPGSKLIIADHCMFNNVHMNVVGEVIIGSHNSINKGDKFENLSINCDGKIIVGQYNRIQSRVLLRYQGVLTIGNYNNINQGTEIRVDENVEIGDYNQISYNVTIWDTNTHNIYNHAKRRELAERYFPVFGYECEKPKTKVVKIADDCWIGKGSSILKGSVIGSRCIVGYQTTIIDKEIPENSTVVQELSYQIFKNNI